MISTSFLSRSQSCASRTTQLSGFTAFSDDASRLINITSSRVCMSGIVSGGAGDSHFRRSSHALPVWHGQTSGIDQLLSNPARSAFLSRAAIRSPDSALLIWLRTRLSRVPALLPVKSHRYLCAQQPFPVQKLQQINLRPHSNYQYITDNIRTGSGFCIIQQFFRIVPRCCRATATEVASTREPGIFRLISSYYVLQLVRDHPLLKCTYLYRCTTTGLTGFKNQPPEWFLLPEKPVK